MPPDILDITLDKSLRDRGRYKVKGKDFVDDEDNDQIVTFLPSEEVVDRTYTIEFFGKARQPIPTLVPVGMTGSSLI